MLFDFQINFSNVSAYENCGVLENIVKGPGALISKYNAAMAAIVVEKKEQESIGSGSVVNYEGTNFILTNRHVVDPQQGFRILKVLLANKDCAVAKSELIVSESDDLAALPLSVALPSDHPRFFLGLQGLPLQEVILFGFPKIPRTVQPHMTAHSGEINAIIETWRGEELYLISNYASPGSSGGPLIDYRGLIVGVISDSLEAEYEGGSGLFQHSAAVTLTRVEKFIRGDVLPRLKGKPLQ